MITGELHLFDAEGYFAEVIYPIRLAIDEKNFRPLASLFAHHDLDDRGVGLGEVEAECQSFRTSACPAYKDSGPAVLFWPDCPAEQCAQYTSCPYCQLLFISGKNPTTGEEVGHRLKENYLGGSSLALAASLIMERYVEKMPSYPVGRLWDDLRTWLERRTLPGTPAAQVLGLIQRCCHRGFVVGRGDVFGYSGYLMPGEAFDLAREAEQLAVGGMAPEPVKLSVNGLIEASKAAVKKQRGLAHGLF